MAEDADLAFRATDYEGVEVTCTKDRWQTKVEANHPQLVGCSDEAAAIVGDPEIVARDRDYPNRKHHIRLRPGSSYFKVVVAYDYDSPTEKVIGTLVTAFLQDRLRADDEYLYIRARR